MTTKARQASKPPLVTAITVPIPSDLYDFLREACDLEQDKLRVPISMHSFILRAGLTKAAVLCQKPTDVDIAHAYTNPAMRYTMHLTAAQRELLGHVSWRFNLLISPWVVEATIEDAERRLKREFERTEPRASSGWDTRRKNAA